MSKKQAIILLLTAILLGFLMIQPFNYICRITDKCYPIILSYYLPKSTGKEQYEVFFMAKDYLKEVQFEPVERSKIVTAGDDVSMVYHAKNISNHDIKIRPIPYLEPEEASKYIKFYECLCFREHKIKAGESIDMVVRLNIKRAIEEDQFFKESRIIVTGYEVK